MSRKVLFVHDGPLYTNEKAQVFGIQYTEEVKQRYLQLGDTVTFCMREKKISNSEGSKFSRISDENFKFVPFPNFKSLSTYFKKPKAKAIIGKLVKEHDLVVARMPSASGSIAIKEARKNNTPYFVEMVACTYDAYRFFNWKGKLIAPYKLFKIRNIIKDCTHVLYVTKHFLQERYPTKGLSIHCSDVKLNCQSEDVLKRRLDKIKKHIGPVVLGSIGIVEVKYKGHADVIKALHKLKSKNMIFNYKIVGEGNSNRLQQLINALGMASQIEVVGALPSNKINEFLESIDLYIQPSKTEGLPRALIEAMAVGCPAAGSKVGGIPELLNADCLFKAGNVNDIAACVRSFNTDKLIKQTKRNYGISKEYQSDVLEQRRSEFFKRFLHDSKFSV